MSQFHRHNPELVGTDADPWMQHEWYRKALPPTEAEVDDAYSKLPPATRRCWDCGVGSGPCQCTPEFQACERAMEDELPSMPPQQALNRSKPLRRDTEKSREFVARGRRSSAQSLSRAGQASGPRARRRPISEASPAQRAKIAANPVCVGCGREQTEWLAIDPAHLCSRAAGGCDDEACVVGLCRAFDGSGCHHDFDQARTLDLLPMLEPTYRREQAHCVMHMGVARAYARLTNDRHAGARLTVVPEDAA